MDKLKEILGPAPSEMSGGQLSEFARSELNRINEELEGLQPQKRTRKSEGSQEERIKTFLDMGFSRDEAIALLKT